MDYWKILELEPNADLKTIKKSYAKKLKNNKPDENPEGFKELHEAYKYAVSVAKQRARDTQFESVDENIIDEDSEAFLQVNQGLNISDNKIFDDEDSHHNFFGFQNNHISDDNVQHDENEYQLLDQVTQLIQSKSQVNNIDKWNELFNDPNLYDIQFKRFFTFELFELLITQLKKTNKEIVIKRETILYLNQKMLWSQQIDQLDKRFDYQDIELFIGGTLSSKDKFLMRYTCPDQHEGEMIPVDLLTRVVAFTIDSAICGLGVLLLFFLLHCFLEGSFYYILAASFIWIFLFFAGMESSSLQGTPGKILFNIKVVNAKGHRIHFFHACYRLLVFLPFYISSFGFLINIILGVRRMLHDRISGSVVIRR